MKRARLPSTGFEGTGNTASGPDLTDRLLGAAPRPTTGQAAGESLPTAGATTQRKSRRRRSTRPTEKPQVAQEATPPSPAEDVSEPLAFRPYRPVPAAEQPGPRRPALTAPRTEASLPQAPEPLATAIQKSQEAIQALVTAADAAPARYDLAIRYRLDALAHHLEQVADFLRSARQSS